MAKMLISHKPFYNTDPIVSGANHPDDICNVYLEHNLEGLYTFRRRPGLSLFADLGTGAPGDGLFWWSAKKQMIAVSGGRTFILHANGTATDITSAPLKVGTPVTFSAGQRLNGNPFLYLANGALAYIDNTGMTTLPTGASAPTTATHATYLNLRFLANTPGTSRFLFTDTDPDLSTLSPTYWESSDNPLSCEAKGDTLLSLSTFLQDIYAWGAEGLEIWQDDGVTPFIPIPQAFSEIGLLAPYSVAQADNTIFALCTINNKRLVIRLSGRTPMAISEPIENILASYGNVSDAIGSVIGVNGYSLYLLQFPSAGKTWCYDFKNDTWCPWGTWDVEHGRMGAFIGQHSAFAPPWNKHLIMSRVDGKIYELDHTVFTDDGLPVKSYRRSSWMDHGSLKQKTAVCVEVKLKTGESADGACYMRLMDNNSDVWSPYIDIPVSPVGHRFSVARLDRLGSYYTRKYEFSISDDADFVVADVQETVQMARY